MDRTNAPLGVVRIRVQHSTKVEPGVSAGPAALLAAALLTAALLAAALLAATLLAATLLAATLLAAALLAAALLAADPMTDPLAELLKPQIRRASGSLASRRRCSRDENCFRCLGC